MHFESSSYSCLKLAITFWQRIDRIFGDEFWTDLNLIWMLVRKSQLTIGWTRMIKIVGLFVCNSIGLWSVIKIPLRPVTARVICALKLLSSPVGWFVWFQVLKLIGRLMPESKWLAYSFDSDESSSSGSHLHCTSLTSQFAPLDKPSATSRETASACEFTGKFNLNRTIPKRG